MTQLLENFWPISMQDRKNYKMHLAVYNHKYCPIYAEHDEPLSFLERNDWSIWQEYRPKSGMDVFNRDYIFSLANYYHSGGKRILVFGGVYEVLSRPSGIYPNNSYKVKLTNQHKNLIGCLVVRMLPQYDTFRNTRLCMENQYHKFEVVKILTKPFHYGQI